MEQDTGRQRENVGTFSDKTSATSENTKTRRSSNYPRKLSRKSTCIKVVPSVPRNRAEFLHWYGWGYSDSGFTMDNGVVKFMGERYALSGKELPYLKDYMKEKYGIVLSQDSDEAPVLKLPDKNDYPPSKFREEIIIQIENLGIEVSTDGVTRFTRSKGQAFDDVWKLRRKDMSRIPDAVAWPTCHEEVVQLVKLADELNFVIIPYGGGTSVARDLECPVDEMRPILSLDTNLMNEILWVNQENMTICAESGIIGQDLERELNHIGFTMGHEPDSIEFSTLGGWVSTRASGMKKNLYGNIEDIVIHARLVTPKGVLDKQSQAARMSCGPDLNHLILGSEGNFGVITEVVLKIRPLPECQLHESIVFPDFATGIAFMREVALRRWQPASIRLMDEEQFQIGWALRPKTSFFTELIEATKIKFLVTIKGFTFNKICLCTIAHEGTKSETAEHIKKVMKLAVEMNGIQAGPTVGQRGYMMTYVVAYMRDIAFECDLVAESMETTIPWDNVYEASVKIRDTVTDEGVRLGALKSLCMMRIAQTYDSGCCLYVYFSFSTAPGADGLAMCRQMNNAIKSVALKYGGSLSHHHGVGKMKRKYFNSFISHPGVSILKGVKQQLDPNNIFGCRNLLEDYYSNEGQTHKSKL